MYPTCFVISFWQAFDLVCLFFKSWWSIEITLWRSTREVMNLLEIYLLASKISITWWGISQRILQMWQKWCTINAINIWVQENPLLLFYKETRIRVTWGLNRKNMPFTIGIQNAWQQMMTLKHGYKNAASIDATFATNENKAIIFLPLFSTCLSYSIWCSISMWCIIIHLVLMFYNMYYFQLCNM